MKLKIRINELARELEVKPNKILELLPDFGVQEKKTHSSSIDEDVALAIKRRFGIVSESGNGDLSDDGGSVAVAVEEPPAATPEAVEVAPPAAERPEEAPIEEIKAEPAPLADDAHAAIARRALPLRPPLATGGATPPTAVRPPLRQQPGVPSPQRPAQPPPAGPGTAAPGVAPREAPIFRPGQVIPRQPSPAGPEGRSTVEARNLPIAPGTPRPAPTPGAPRPIVRTGPTPAPGGPPPQPSQPSQAQPGARPALAGQPTARPVVPPRPDMLARLQQTQTRPPVPGTPAPRPPVPGRPAAPGQPLVHRGPIRPGQPLVRPGPGGPARPVLRPRTMHPTSPRLEPASPIPATEVQRRMQGRGRTAVVEDRRRDAEGKLRPVITKREPVAPPPIDREITIGEGVTVKELSEKLGVKTAFVIKKLVDRKIFATINQALDTKLAEEIAREFGASTNALS